MTHTIGESVQDAWLPIGSKVKVQGREFLIVDVRSKVNYEALGDDGKRYKLKRDGRYIYAGFDLDAANQAFQDSLPKVKMGDIVRVTGGRFEGKVGIVAMTAAKSVTIALPNEGSIRIGGGGQGLEVVGLPALASYITR